MKEDRGVVQPTTPSVLCMCLTAGLPLCDQRRHYGLHLLQTLLDGVISWRGTCGWLIPRVNIHFRHDSVAAGQCSLISWKGV